MISEGYQTGKQQHMPVGDLLGIGEESRQDCRGIPFFLKIGSVIPQISKKCGAGHALRL
jgi:hypothetical protein